MYKQASSEKIFHEGGTGMPLSLEESVIRIRDFIVKKEGRYEIVIGSDSEAALRGYADFVSSIVVRRVGNGAIYFWTRSRERFYNMRDRIQKETMRSILLAQECKSLLKEMAGEEILWDRRVTFTCIHLDVGEIGPTKDLVDTVRGMVKGYGFEPVIKPYSYGAFVVADRHT